MAHVFLTGGGGFLANHLAEDWLRRGHRVSMLVRHGGTPGVPAGVRVVRGDLVRSQRPIIPPSAELVYHLAAKSNVPESIAEPTAAFEVNARGTARLLEEVRTRGLRLRRFVLASTAQVYGPPFGRPLREDHPTLPRNPYSASKLAAESYAIAIGGLFDIPVAVLRPFNVYGPGQRAHYVIASVLRQCLSSAELRIGNPWPVRDFLYVDDAVELFRLVGTRPSGRGEVLNVGSGRGTRILEVVRLAARAAHSDLRAQVDPGRQRANDFDWLVADTSRARRLLGWRPRVSLPEGLARTAEWMRRERDPDDAP